MNTRIAMVRKESGKNQTEFAEILGLTKNYISLVETGKREPSDRTIKDICKSFNINEEWLRYGTGEKKSTLSTDYVEIMTNIGVSDKKAKQAIINYWNLSEQDKELFWNFLDRFMKNEDK